MRNLNFAVLHRSIGLELQALYSSWHLQRCICLSLLLSAVMRHKTVNLSDLSEDLQPRVKPNSSYSRLQRFFRQVRFPRVHLARWILQQVYEAEHGIHFCLDRTNWYFGSKPVNILMLSIDFRGSALPFLWLMIPHGGCSSTEMRIKLLKQALRIVRQLYPSEKPSVLADREFVDTDWLAFLKANEVRFGIRLKTTNSVTNKKGKPNSVKKLFQGLPRGRFESTGKRRVLGIYCYVSAFKGFDGGIYAIAHFEKLDYPQQAFTLYSKRWKVETLFQNLKSRGFHFEDTHFTKPARISKLIAVLALACLWALKAGWTTGDDANRLKTKKHGRLAVSLFTQGRKFIVNKLCDFRDTWNLFQILITPFQNQPQIKSLQRLLT